MKLLAFSDIHHNLMAVRKLRALESNSFDAIVVAGDIGAESAAEFFQIMTTFKCPVFYVYGNWDHQLSYNLRFGDGCHLVHDNLMTLEDFSFTGFSGCPTNWGRNPIFLRRRRELEQCHQALIERLAHASYGHSGNATTRAPRTNGKTKPNLIERIKRTRAYQNYVADMRRCNSETLRLNRECIGKAVRKMNADPRKCIVIAHERIPRLNEELPGALLHLFGHIHQFSVRDFKGTKYVDVAAVDRHDLFRGNSASLNDPVTVDAGNYATIEISRSLDVRVICMSLRRDGRSIKAKTGTS